MRLEHCSKALDNVSSCVNAVSDRLGKLYEPNANWVYERAADYTCKNCGLHVYCWEKERGMTLDDFHRLTEVLKERGSVKESDIADRFLKRCCKMGELSHSVNRAYRDLLSNEVVQVGITVPLLDWGKRKGQRRMAESNREIVQGQLRQQAQDFRQNIFILTEQFNNQAEQLRIACEADTIARRRYLTNVETFKIGSISTLELSDAQKAKDQARQNRIQQLFNYWYYYYQLRSIALWDFERGCDITADVEKLIK